MRAARSHLVSDVGVVVAGCSLEGMLGLEDRVCDKLPDMFVREAVVHPGSGLPCGDNAAEAQLGQMLGYRCLGFLDQLRQLVDRQFAVAQRKNDADPGGVGEHCKDLDGELDVLAIRLPAAHSVICIHAYIVSYG